MSKLFLGGIPTAPDVKKLREAIGELIEGRDIAHDEVRAILGLEPRSSRYRSVTTAWRREMLNEHNIEISAIPSIGFRVLPQAEQLTTNIKGFKQGTRKQGKSVRRIAQIETEKLSEAEQQKHMHMVRLGTQVVQHAGSIIKQIEPPKAQEQLSLLRRPPTDSAAQPDSGARS